MSKEDNTKPFIEIYEFHKAPRGLKEFSGHGGDEDWIVVLNGHDENGVAETIAEELAVCGFSTSFDHANNRLVYICTHA